MARTRAFRERIRRRFSRAASHLREHPWDVGAYAVTLVAALTTVAWPLSVSRYPAMTDLPFHAATTSVFRHYFDPSYHFREQFEFQLLAVPYVSQYALGAFFMLFLPAVTAVKVATALLLLLLPAGLGVLSWGMRKSPLLGAAGLPFIWCDLTHWGFINFVGALGLFAMVVGLALRALDRPSRKTQVALGLALVALFFTHIFRFPFGICGVLGAVIVAYPATGRWHQAIVPALPAGALFAVFMTRRASGLGGSLGPMTIDTARLEQIPTSVVHGFVDPAEMANAVTYLKVLGIVAVVSLASLVAGFVRQPAEAVAEAAEEPLSERKAVRAFFDRHFTGLVTVVPLACAGVALLMFLTLPMEIGIWWYVYPREATAACFLALGCLPDLPRFPALRAALVVALAAASMNVTQVVANGYAAFGHATEDFAAIDELIPRAPKLLYLVFDHAGSNRTNTPFIHLPAYIQAEKGGWLSFHFAVWGASPVKYRTDADAVVPPPVPNRWEWTPDKFDLARQGPFFDWFLVRSPSCPDGLFVQDPTIVRVARRGTWWLYHRLPVPAL